MLLTVFYAASTWLQSWRLSAIKRRILQYSGKETTIVIYKVPQYTPEEDLLNCLTLGSISSKLCKNEHESIVSDLLWDDRGIRACTLYPKQIINLDNWIEFSEGEINFPISLVKPDNITPLFDPRIWVLLEAVSLNLEMKTLPFDVTPCRLLTIGRPKAWKISDTFGLLLESDINHLAELTGTFVNTSMILIDDGFAIEKIQTVSVEGKPCEVLNTDRIAVVRSPTKTLDLALSSWPRRPSLHMSPLQWKSHVDLLRSFSSCADEASLGKSVTVPEHRSAIITKGTGRASLHSPTIIDIPEECLTDDSKSPKLDLSLPDSQSLSPYETNHLESSSFTEDFTSANLVVPESTPSKISNKKSTFSHLQPMGAIGSRGSLASISSLSSFSTVSTMRSNKVKPPNVLVYCESVVTTDNIKRILNETLHKHKYTVYSISKDQLVTSTWAVNCSLLVICGNVPEHAESILIQFLVTGGKLLCLCSSFLHTLLPTFRTAEVRERELVRFTYGKWNRVRLMHHVFCYQNSPARTKFSREADEPPNEKDRISPVPQAPATIQIPDCEGRNHTLHVQVLGTEETWQTPSLILAYLPSPAGRAVFSQVHLELDPSEIDEEREVEALRSSDKARRQIIKDLLVSHLAMQCASNGETSFAYTTAYFLGKHEYKLAFLERIKYKERDGLLKINDIALKFYGKGEQPAAASATLLPILIHACPQDFSTLEYFETLETKNIGRLLLYCEVMRSSMDILTEDLAHGIAVVPSHQTAGKGRSGNQWLSPPGCAMFSLQIHLPADSYLGQHPSLMQHVVATAIVTALSDISPRYKQALELHLKWPNDIYTREMVKVGGVLCTCSISKETVVFNIGSGINLDNESPTTCLNSEIDFFNKSAADTEKIKKLTREKLLGLVFNKLEEFIEKIQMEDSDSFYQNYYHYWLHSGAEVHVVDVTGDTQLVTVAGIDDYGFLRVREHSGRIFTVQPDGNSFDMMDGLISPKLY